MFEPEYRRVMQALDDVVYRIADARAGLYLDLADLRREPEKRGPGEFAEAHGRIQHVLGQIEGLDAATLVLAQYGRGVSVEYHSGRPMRAVRPR